MRIYKNLFNSIVSLENLFLAWETFKSDKSRKPDVQEFEFHLEENLFTLHKELISQGYVHGHYEGFYIRDPKVRRIHKAKVKDRVLHHAVFRVLNQIFENTFIANSFSCRINKGTHKGVLTLEKMIRKENQNYTQPCFVLKCDIKKFFDSIDQAILFSIIRKRIKDPKTMCLIEEIIGSYNAKAGRAERERERERE